MFIFILQLIEKQPGFGVLLKVEADRLSDWNGPDLIDVILDGEKICRACVFRVERQGFYEAKHIV